MFLFMELLLVMKPWAVYIVNMIDMNTGQVSMGLVLAYRKIRFSTLTKILDYHLAQHLTNACFIAGNFWACFYGGDSYGYTSITGIFFEETYIEDVNYAVGSRLSKN